MVLVEVQVNDSSIYTSFSLGPITGMGPFSMSKYELFDNFEWLEGGDCIKTDHLKVKKIRRGYIVVNTNTGQHTHMRSQYGAYCVIKFIQEGIEPINSYLKESVRRLTEDKKKRKDKYINVQKGAV